jgi:hypothetical protein
VSSLSVVYLANLEASAPTEAAAHHLLTRETDHIVLLWQHPSLPSSTDAIHVTKSPVLQWTLIRFRALQFGLSTRLKALSASAFVKCTEGSSDPIIEIPISLRSFSRNIVPAVHPTRRATESTAERPLRPHRGCGICHLARAESGQSISACLGWRENGRCRGGESEFRGIPISPFSGSDDRR